MKKRRALPSGETRSYGAALGKTGNLGVIKAVFYRERTWRRRAGVKQERRAVGRLRRDGDGDRDRHEVESVDIDIDPHPVAFALTLPHNGLKFDVAVTLGSERRRPAGWRAGVPPAFMRGGEDAASPAAGTAALQCPPSD